MLLREQLSNDELVNNSLFGKKSDYTSNENYLVVFGGQKLRSLVSE